MSVPGTKRSRDAPAAGGENAPGSSDASPASADPSDPGSSVTFGFYVWTEVSMVLFYRFMKEVQAASIDLAVLAGDPAGQATRLRAFEMSMVVIWEVGKEHLPSEERDIHDRPIRRFAGDFVTGIREALAEVGSPDPGADKPPRDETVARGEAVIEACRVLERVLEEHGFPDDEGGGDPTMSGGLAQLITDTRQETELNCYSYSERSTLRMPLLPRYDGEKRAEEEYRHARAGHAVMLPFPHPHPEVSTSVQLNEPKKRRSNLDEHRIFSHPKKTTTHAVEDFLVEEELNHRAYLVLRQHLDSHGSLRDLSPYARFLLWNVLGRDDVAFGKVLDQPAATPDARRRLEETRVLVGAKLASFEEVRPAAREAAQRIGWCAVSAQWRDQALSRLEDAEDGDWCLLGDAAKSGGSAIFPNYTPSPEVVALATAVLHKLDAHYVEGREDEERDEQWLAVAPVAAALLLPLLRGACPDADSVCATLAGGEGGARVAGGGRWQRDGRRLRSIMTRVTPASRPPVSDSPLDGQDAAHFYFCPTLLFPLQCFAELLELCSLAQFAECGFEGQSAHMSAGDWHDEEGLLALLLRTEPLNPAVAPMVAIPKLYRDLVTGVQILQHDRMLHATVEAYTAAAERSLCTSPDGCYVYWKTLSSFLQEEDRQDDLLCLSCESPPPYSSAVGLPLYVVSTVERARRVWPQDLADLLGEEAQYKMDYRLECC